MKMDYDVLTGLDRQSAIALLLEVAVAFKTASEILEEAKVDIAKKYPHSFLAMQRAHEGLEKCEADSAGYALVCEVENDKLRHIAYAHASDILELFAEHEKHLLECIQRAKESTDPDDEPGPVQIATPLSIDLSKNVQQTTIGYSLKHKGKKKRLIPNPEEPDLFRKPTPKSAPIATPPPAESAEPIGHANAIVLRGERRGDPVGDVIDVETTERPARAIAGVLEYRGEVSAEETPAPNETTPPASEGERELGMYAMPDPDPAPVSNDTGAPIEELTIAEIEGTRDNWNNFTKEGSLEIPPFRGEVGTTLVRYREDGPKNWNATLYTDGAGGQTMTTLSGPYKTRAALLKSISGRELFRVATKDNANRFVCLTRAIAESLAAKVGEEIAQ